MKFTFISIVLIIIYILPADAARLYKEKEYQKIWCEKAGGITEYVLNDNTRVDCLTDEYAIEFDFAPKWAEAVGQSLFYALKTKKKPGIVLILEKETDNRYFKRLKLLSTQYDIKLWVVWPEDIKKHH